MAVNLVDSFYCSNPEVFISAGLTSLISMINLEMPAVNVLSKIDLITKYGSVDYDLDYYTELPDISRMLFGVDRYICVECFTVDRTGRMTLRNRPEKRCVTRRLS